MFSDIFVSAFADFARFTTRTILVLVLFLSSVLELEEPPLSHHGVTASNMPSTNIVMRKAHGSYKPVITFVLQF